MKQSSYIKKLLDTISKKDKGSKKDSSPNPSNISGKTFSSSLKENEKTIEDYLGTSQDVMISKFMITLKNGEQLSAALVAIDGLVDEEAKRGSVIRPLIESPLKQDVDKNLKEIRERLSVKKISIEQDVEKVIDNILKSQAFLLVDGVSQGIMVSIEGFEIRSVEEPETEQTVRGAREGFIESIGVNLSLIRRRIAHPSLRFETLQIGEYSNTDVVIAYIEDITDPKLLKRVKKRLNEIDVDMMYSSGEIEQLIEDQPYSIFPTVGNTERPDKAASLLMEGRVLVLMDGDPVSLYVPFLFVESIKNIEDYNSRPYYTSFIRIIRFLAFILSITLPALYISAVNFNKALIPSDMVVPLTVAREAVPFPLALEVMIMILMFEVVREAGVRLPKQIGTAVSIVGPLILGDVAVSSSLVGAPTVIIVSISYIAAFVITPIADVTALVRIGLFIAASVFGSYGLVVALLALFIHMVSLTSLGIPYMAPFSPFHISDWRDAFVRFPTRLLKFRAESVPNQRSRKVRNVPNTGGKE